jgi:hypothetical protein
MDKNLSTLVHLLAQQAAKEFLQAPELVNSYYLLDKAKRPDLIKKAQLILDKSNFTKAEHKLTEINKILSLYKVMTEDQRQVLLESARQMREVGIVEKVPCNVYQLKSRGII